MQKLVCIVETLAPEHAQKILLVRQWVCVSPFHIVYGSTNGYMGRQQESDRTLALNISLGHFPFSKIGIGGVKNCTTTQH